ncbi:MAG: hypothetical protein ABI619_09165, partial [Betaproteobacteria bacterium]
KNKGGTIKTTTTTYATGALVTVTETFDKKGKLVGTVVTNVPPPGGSGGSSGGGLGQNLTPPSTVSGYQQSRNSGKLGRVTWHELFGQ